MGFLSVKTVLISTGILSMAMGLKLTVPVVSNFIFTEAAPTLSTFFLTCFTPPYLYLLLNFIILTIVATSKLHNHNNSPPDTVLLPTEPLIHAADVAAYGVHIPAPEPVKILENSQIDYNGEMETTPVKVSGGVEMEYNGVVSGGYVYEVEAKTHAVIGGGGGGNGFSVIGGEEENLAPILQRKESLEFAFNDENEKPPVSARFGHRKTVRSSPEGVTVVALGVTKPKRQETLESTWRTITEGRAMPLTRHLKKSETMETQPRRNAAPLADLNGPVMKKSETFGGREKKAAAATSSQGSGGKLRKESSLSQDELNRRVEAFINKFNAEMRLQRQESLRQYKEMVNRV